MAGKNGVCVEGKEERAQRKRREMRRTEEKYIEREEGARDARINKYLKPKIILSMLYYQLSCDRNIPATY